MKKIKFKIIYIILCAFIFGCKESPVNNTDNQTLILQIDGVIENIGGDCSGVQVRTRNLGTLDFTNSNKIKFNFSGMSDADLSSISIYYFQNDEQIYLLNLQDRNMINSTNSVEVNSPRINTEIFTRVTLKSSVCTGQIFYISFSDLKIYTIQ